MTEAPVFSRVMRPPQTELVPDDEHLWRVAMGTSEELETILMFLMLSTTSYELLRTGGDLRVGIWLRLAEFCRCFKSRCGKRKVHETFFHSRSRNSNEKQTGTCSLSQNFKEFQRVLNNSKEFQRFERNTIDR
jgi:hypothetical protein